MKRLIIIFCLAVVIFAVTACAPAPTAPTTSDSSVVITPSSSGYAQGTGIVVNVTKTERSAGTKEIVPGSGADTNEFVIVTVQVINIDKTDQTFDTKSFFMQNSKGEKSSPGSYKIGQSTELKSGTLKPGESATGTLLFTEPKGDIGLVLLYENGSTYWSISLQ